MKLPHRGLGLPHLDRDMVLSAKGVSGDVPGSHEKAPEYREETAAQPGI